MVIKKIEGRDAHKFIFIIFEESYGRKTVT